MTDWKHEPCPRKCGRAVIFAQNDVGAVKLVEAEPRGTGTLKVYKGPHGETRVTVLKPAKLRYGRKDLRVYHECRWGRR